MLAVTGATGFVGRHLCAALEEAGLPYRPIGRHAKPGQPGVGEIGPDTDWRTALSGVSGVIHLAGRVHQMHEGAADPLAAHRRTNVLGTLALARQARLCGVQRFVFVSTIKVNGETTAPGQPFRAGDRPRPSDPYAQSKWEAETKLWALAAENGLEVIVVRPPLVYGAGVGANFRALVSLAQRGLPLPLARINNRRSLIAVENFVDLLRHCATHPEAPGGTFLCSDGDDLSTPELIRAIGRASGRAVPLWPVPVPALRMLGTLIGRKAAVDRLTQSLQVDMTTTRQRLGWQPPITLADAMARAAAANWRL